MPQVCFWFVNGHSATRYGHSLWGDEALQCEPANQEDQMLGSCSPGICLRNNASIWRYGLVEGSFNPEM